MGKVSDRLSTATWGNTGSGSRRFIRTSQTMSVYARPLNLTARLRKAGEHMGWRGLGNQSASHVPVLGMHVRDGDSCGDEARHLNRNHSLAVRECVGLHGDMPDVVKVARRYNIRHIYLATDGGERVYNQTKDYPEFTWYFQNRRKWQDANDEITESLIKGTHDVYAIGTETLMDAWTLAQADVLVGKFTSNVFRAAVEISSGENGCVKPYVSLDAMWCMEWGLPRGKVVRGRFAGRLHGC